MKSRYAVLGWGSLIWDLDNLAPFVSLPWHMNSGPALPMEFTRISPKRKMGLAVCLDPDHGAPCPTHAIASSRFELPDAIADLAARERAPLERIGGVCLRSGTAQGRSFVVDTVRVWCQQAGWSGAVWTDLTTNYQDMRGAPFSIPDAIAYLRTLGGDSLDEAVRYIENAPTGTATPLRAALAQDGWWQQQARRLAP